MAARGANGRFKPGTSGNPAGRPQASLRQRLQEGSPGIVEKVLEMAAEGDMAACRLILERTCSPIKAHSDPVQFTFDECAPLSDQARMILKAVSLGELPVEQGTALLNGMANVARMVELDEIERRLSAIESA